MARNVLKTITENCTTFGHDHLGPALETASTKTSEALKHTKENFDAFRQQHIDPALSELTTTITSHQAFGRVKDSCEEYFVPAIANAGHVIGEVIEGGIDAKEKVLMYRVDWENVPEVIREWILQHPGQETFLRQDSAEGTVVSFVPARFAREVLWSLGWTGRGPRAGEFLFFLLFSLSIWSW